MSASRVSRRSLLGAAGSAGAGILLAGCGSSAASSSKGAAASTTTPARPLTPTAAADGEMLNGLLEQEHRLVLAYTDVAGRLTGSGRALANSILAQEHRHVAALESRLRVLGITPTRPPGARTRVAPADRSSALAALSQLENQTIALYIDSLPKIGTPETRAFAAEVAANEAQHLALLATAAGAAPLPVALVTGHA